MARDVQTSAQALVGAVWDLRDHCSDHAGEQWKVVSAESVFQVMAEIIERSVDADEDIDWRRFPSRVQDALLQDDP